MSNNKVHTASNGSIQLTALLIGDSNQNNPTPLNHALRNIGYKLTGVITTSNDQEIEGVHLHIKTIIPKMIILSMECTAINGGKILDFLDKIPGYKRQVMKLGKCGHHYVWRPKSPPR